MLQKYGLILLGMFCFGTAFAQTKAKTETKTKADSIIKAPRRQIEVRQKPLITLPELIVEQRLNRVKTYRRLRDVEGTTVNVGRKNEVVLLKDMTINKVTNSARQIFAKVVGLTINESSEGGLQMNIGGRGLNPNRTANFNTRQNGYDISADVLGYPESYYTPPAEAVREIQLIRGASALQYGTQFGGMINFKMNRPPIEPVKLEQHLSYGSHNLLSSFTSLGGKLGKFSYYTYFNYKQGDGFRPNSEFRSFNGFANLNCQINRQHSLHLDWLKYHYLARQAGGLTDLMFYTDPNQSNRPRNWFRVDWNVLNLKYKWQIDESSRFSANVFGLMAERSALGFRSNRVAMPDDGKSRDLLIGKFRNWGAELRYLKKYSAFGKKNTLLVGSKYYQSRNSSQQGAGSSSDRADFYFADKEFPNYERRSRFSYPNLNFASFAENIIYLSKNTSITPGLRLEYIRTESDGSYRIIAQHAGQVLNDSRQEDKVVKERFIALFGVSLSHKMSKFELYANLSQNYRSVTFNDIHSNTPGFAIAPSITDEKGFSSDVGLRGNFGNLYLDCSAYLLYYGNKIGEYYHTNKITGAVERYRDNVGTALTYGFESMLNWNISKTFFPESNIRLSAFLNSSFTGSRYLASDIPNIKGNEVEFVPLVNMKTGLEFGYKGLRFSTQMSYVSEQFAEATNQVSKANDNLYGIFGTIPAYAVWDATCSYRFNKHWALEASLQNITNNAYFTQRATGYPGPGIIPSAPMNFITTLSFSY